MLTGIGVRVGNFSIMPFAYLSTLVVQSELWNHYAASVFRSKRSFKMIPISRGKRIAGASQMSLVSLVVHGLSAISVFGDLVGTRLVIASIASAIFATALITMAVVALFVHGAISDWAAYAVGSLALVFTLLITMSSIFTLFVLANRTNLCFVPLRDCSPYIAEVADLYAP
jgi:hypothetical protein